MTEAVAVVVTVLSIYTPTCASVLSSHTGGVVAPTVKQSSNTRSQSPLKG